MSEISSNNSIQQNNKVSFIDKLESIWKSLK